MTGPTREEAAKAAFLGRIGLVGRRLTGLDDALAEAFAAFGGAHPLPSPEAVAAIIAPSAFAVLPSGAAKYASRQGYRDRALTKARDILALIGAPPSATCFECGEVEEDASTGVTDSGHWFCCERCRTEARKDAYDAGTLLALFPEGRSEQDQEGPTLKEIHAFYQNEKGALQLDRDCARAELSAARLLIKALEAQLARVQPLLSDEDRMHPVGCSTWVSDAFVIGEEITALLSSAQGETRPVEQPQQRFGDAVDASRAVHDWINAVAEADGAKGQPGREIRILTFNEDDGGAVIYSSDNQVRAAGMIVRDTHNHSIALRMFGDDLPLAPDAAALVEGE